MLGAPPSKFLTDVLEDLTACRAIDVVGSTEMVSASAAYRAMGLFSSPERAIAAVKILLAADFPRERISFIAKHTKMPNTPIGARATRVQVKARHPEIPAGDPATCDPTGIKTVGAELFGITATPVFWLIPGIGPIFAIGRLATDAFTRAITEGMVGVESLADLGIPPNRVRDYQDAIAAGKYLMLLEGTESQLARAAEILASQQTGDWQVFAA